MSDNQVTIHERESLCLTCRDINRGCAHTTPSAIVCCANYIPSISVVDKGTPSFARFMEIVPSRAELVNYAKQLDSELVAANKRIDSMKCCGNCGNEDLSIGGTNLCEAKDPVSEEFCDLDGNGLSQWKAKE